MTRALLLALLLAQAGCLQRRIHITTSPPGASVWLNDVHVGTTPLDAEFLYYGVYDVRITRDGYEPISEARTAPAPLYERPPIDLLAEALPANIDTVIHWHFDLTPATPLDDQGRRELVGRARAFRDRTTPPTAAQAPAPEPPPPSPPPPRP